MKFSRYLIPIALTIAVVVSLTLSVVLWTNPANYRSKQNSEQNPQTEQLSKPKSYVYTPIQAVHTNSDGTQEILVNRLVNAVTEIKKTMQGYHDAKIKTLSRDSQTKYLNIANRPDSIMLNYSSPVSIKVVNQIVNHRFKNFPNHTVNRIVLPTNNSTKLYLLNDKNFAVYQVSVQHHDLKNLNKVLDMNIRTIPASLRLFNKQPMVYVDDSVQMQPYKYLVDRQSQDYFVSRLMNNEESQNVTAKRRRNLLIYSDQNSLQLTFNSQTRMVEFSDYRTNKDQRAITSVLNNSYKDLVKLGLPLDNVRFFRYDTKTRTVMYRTFVEGFPIFRANGFGTISTRIMNSSAKRLNFSLDNPEVPIPSKRGYTTLPATEVVIRRLVAHGYKTKNIQQMRIGYGWQKDKESQLLINLIPDWYIYYNNQWRSYTSLMNQY
ncbi:two-component system activity regulator YycH [Lentilactobacillus diolivorans]|uniref:YycH family regulatory protein n=1 Tax=Lentilactobacillus diolivorans TaxID=179838 RepID=UPI0024691A9A|nr:two-component system activity regulator YycH [Lentilactobacillus diolivorans]MDH5104850.1 two-component system activity regulator YycH [Lentilactobacillus diolivorans]